MKVNVFRATADQVIPVRHRVLRRGQPIDRCHYPEDTQPAARHWVAMACSGSGPTATRPVIGCLSAYREALPRSLDGIGTGNAEHWRLRGMAVLPAFQKQGIGTSLLACALDELKSTKSAALIWCNARASAVGFYQQAGFKTHGSCFEIPGIGPHFVMWALLSAAQATAADPAVSCPD